MPNKETVSKFIRRIGKEYGFIRLSVAEVDYLLWERTGYPTFFAPKNGQTVLQEFERQVRAEFRRWRRAVLNAK